jgi:alpha-L-fucosidase
MKSSRRNFIKIMGLSSVALSVPGTEFIMRNRKVFQKSSDFKISNQNGYQGSWNSLQNHNIPEWFKNSKFGIYTHWGIYSVPAKGPNGSWYPHNMYKKGTEQYKYHVKIYGLPSRFGYKDFIPMFKAEKFDAEEWSELFKKSGAQFAGPVAEHHDGFSMWDSKVSYAGNKNLDPSVPRFYNAKNMGPKRDIVGELEKAIKKRGMKFITTFHHATHWAFYPHWVNNFDCSDPKYAGLYGPMHDMNHDWPAWYKLSADELAFKEEQVSKEFQDMWFAKLKEVMDNYRPDIIWFDGSLDRMGESSILKFFAYYFNKEKEWGKNVVVVFKGWDVPPNLAVNDLELGNESNLTRHIWITDTSIDDMGAWSYVKEAGYKSVTRLVTDLVDMTSKNGRLLLNVGPKPDGTIPEEAQERLIGLGKWMQINSEAIYDTLPWVLYGEGPTDRKQGPYSEMNHKGDLTAYTGQDIRFTIKNNILYAIALAWPGKEIKIHSLRRLEEELSIYWTENDIRNIKMLGVDKELEWHFTDNALVIKTPDKKPCDHAFVFKIERNI